MTTELSATAPSWNDTSTSVTFLDVVYHQDGYKMRLYVPPSSSSSSVVAGEREREEGEEEKNRLRPAVLDIHGGTWTNLDRTLDVVCNTALAHAGYVVAAIDFRMGPVHQHPAASDDIHTALDWLRHHAHQYRIDPQQMGVLGSSSGGHLALLAGLLPPPANNHHTKDNTTTTSRNNTAAEGNTSDTPPVPEAGVPPIQFIVALWPVADPYERYRYAQRVGRQDLITNTKGYFGTELAMKAASIPRILMSRTETSPLPPLLIVKPAEDANVPLDITFDLVRCYQKNDGYVEYCSFPKQPHAFGLTTSREEDSATDRMNQLIIHFIQRNTTTTATTTATATTSRE